MLFFVPFLWVLAVPALFVIVLIVRVVLWLTLGARRPSRHPEGPFIEGEFVDDESRPSGEDSASGRDRLEK